MKIGIDMSLTVGQKAGVGYYCHHLVKALSEIDERNEYVLYPFFYHVFRPEFKDAAGVDKPNFSIHMKDVPADAIGKMWFDPEQSRKEILGKVDILHSNTFCAPEDHYGKLVVTLHDLTFITHPECHTEANRLHCLKGSMDAALYANRIIAVSQSTKRDIVEYLNVEEERIAVIPEAPADPFKPITDREAIRRTLEKLRIDKKYIFSLGTIEPRKNIASLVKAYAQLPEKARSEFLLVIGGGKGWLDTGVGDLIRQYSLEEQVRFLGYVDEEDLPILYSASELFVYPSLYEGFGLPIAEAMACGTPVITSNNSSMREIAEGAGILIEPTDIQAISEEMMRVLSPGFNREEVRERGIKRMGAYSWKKTALETLRVYEDLNRNC